MVIQSRVQCRSDLSVLCVCVCVCDWKILLCGGYSNIALFCVDQDMHRQSTILFANMCFNSRNCQAKCPFNIFEHLKRHVRIVLVTNDCEMHVCKKRI